MSEDARSGLEEQLSKAEQPPLTSDQVRKFDSYLSLFVRWNSKINLSAIRSEKQIVHRHFVESIVCARALPFGLRSLLDLGSGGGLPGIPISICRPEVAVTLAESQGKKAAFLSEVVRSLELNARVHAGRAETLNGSFDCVTLRAVDKMEDAIQLAILRLETGGVLALMTTSKAADRQAIAAGGFSWREPVKMPGSTDRLLMLGQRC